MTTTDRAFIAAFQQANATWTPPATAPSMAGTGQRVDLPHSRPRPATAPIAATVATGPTSKAPLSEHLARRRAETVEIRPLKPGVEVDTLPWPALAEQLATEARQTLLDLLAAITKHLPSNETPVIALVGAQPRVGTTTVLLALAKLLANVGGRVAIVDASGAEGAAGRLGVRRVAHLDGRIDPTAIDDLMISSRGCGTSVLAVDAVDSGPLAKAALTRLAATHDVVLTDAGDATAWLNAVGAERSAVLVLDTAGTDEAPRHEMVRRLEAAGVTTTGFIETLAAD